MVQLIPMQESELQIYLEVTIPAYAADKVKAGNWSPEEAFERSREEFGKLLPAGVKTPDQYLYNIVDSDENMIVGMIWFNAVRNVPHPFAFVYELHVFDAYQRRGYGRQAMFALETEVKKLGLNTILLHVFGHNQAARSLYDQLGYETTNINMSKRL